MNKDCHKRCMDLVTKGASIFFFLEGIPSKDGKLGVFKDIYKHLGKMSDDAVSEGQFYQVLCTSQELDAIRKDIYKHLGKMSDDGVSEGQFYQVDNLPFPQSRIKLGKLRTLEPIYSNTFKQTKNPSEGGAVGQWIQDDEKGRRHSEIWSFSEELWKRCGGVRIGEFMAEMASKYGRKEDRTPSFNFLKDLDELFISGVE
nr:putative gamma-glutamylcyclotransferase At3g02910 [Ipomoea trifida]